MNDQAHVFVGAFENRDSACKYTEPQWEPEPGENVSYQEYREWEDRNPSWQLRSDLGLDYLDSDCIETIDGDCRYEYLGRFLTGHGAIEKIRELVDTFVGRVNIVVLIFSEALGGFPGEMKSIHLT